MVQRFSGFELDEELYQLRRGAEVLKLEPKAFDVLLYLVRHRDRVVSKDELLTQVWTGQHLSQSVLPTHVRTLRRALGDDRSGQKFIQTVYGRGYRFVAAVKGEAAHEPLAEADAERAPFVGRRDEMAMLESVLAGALEGRGAVALLVGEPGIGKTRTAREIGRVAQRRGARLLPGYSYEGEGAPAFWPWIQVLRASLRERDPELLRGELGAGAAEIASLVPELRDRLSDLPDPAPGGPEQTRFRRFDAVASYLRRAARAQPLVVLLDDLHWADRSSLLLLRFVARELRDAPLLLVGAYRDVELRRGHPLTQVLGELVREDHCHRVRLHGLGREEIAQYLEGVTRRGPSEELVASLHDRTEGNPFFLSEMVRLIAREGLGSETAEKAWSTLLPEGVREAIGRRLDALGEACNAVLGRAALLGVEFSLAPLERLVDLPRTRLLELLEEARAQGIIEEKTHGVGRHAFSHALVRETLYAEISEPQRVQLHRRAGEILEEIHRANLHPHLAELAHHFFQAAAGGSVERAADYGRRAAERAMGLLAWEEAAAHYERVLDVLTLATPVDERARCEALLALGDAYSRAGERGRARSSFVRAGDAARELGDAELLARAALGMGGRHEASPAPDETLRALLEDALAAVGEGDSAWRAALLARLSTVHPYLGSIQQREALTREALEIARRVDARWALVQVLVARAWLFSPTEDLSRRLDIGTQLVEAAERAPGPSTSDVELYDPAWVGRQYRHAALLALGLVDEADRELAELDRIATRERQPFQQFDVCLLHFGRAHAAGRFDEARHWIEQGRAVAERMNPVVGHTYVVQEILLAREQGAQFLPRVMLDIDDLEARRATPFESFGWRDPSTQDVASSDAIRAAMREQIPWLAMFSTALLAHANFQSGKLDEARSELASLAEHGFADVGRDAEWLLIMGLVADVAAGLEDPVPAEPIHARLAAYPTHNVSHPSLHVYLGCVSHFLGSLARVLGRPRQAVEHLELALERNQAMGARAHATRSRLELARALEACGERSRARSLRAQAEAEARELGMGALLG